MYTAQCSFEQCSKKLIRDICQRRRYCRRGRITYDFLQIYDRIYGVCVWVSRMRKTEFVCEKKNAANTRYTRRRESMKEHFLCIRKKVFFSNIFRFTLGCIVTHVFTIRSLGSLILSLCLRVFCYLSNGIKLVIAILN